MLISIIETKGKVALRDLRIIKRDLVYIIGLSEIIADEDKLRDADYLGQYGVIRKIVVNRDKPFNRNSREGPSYSAYVTFATEEEAAIAILAIDGLEYDRRAIKASFGMTKYCSFFIKNLPCPNDDCLYLHKTAKESDCFSKDEGNSTKNLLKISHSGTMQFLTSTKDFSKIFNNKSIGSEFPTLKAVEKMVIAYCAENGIYYEEKDQKKNSKSAKNEKKVLGTGTAHIVTACKWGNDDLPSFNLRSNCINNTQNNLILTKSMSVQQPVVVKETTVLYSKDNISKVNLSGVSQPDKDRVLASTLNPSETLKQSKREKSHDSAAINRTSIDNQSKDPKSRKDSEVIDTCYKDTATTKSMLNPENNSEDHSNDNILEINIDQILEQKSDEYSELDRQILYRLNSSYLKLAKTESRIRPATEPVLTNENNIEVNKKCEGIKMMISTFLQPNTEILTSKSVQSKQDNDDKQFKLFGQSYYIHIPRRETS